MNTPTIQPMTRADFRRLNREKLKAQKKYTLTRAELDEMGARGIEKGLNAKFNEILARETDKVFVVMMTLPSVALHDTFGFGKERLTRFMDNVVDKYECVIEDYDRKARAGYDFDTFISILKDETGFDVTDYLVKRNIIQPTGRGDNH